jgi:hypothetical protein
MSSSASGASSTRSRWGHSLTRPHMYSI